MNKNYGEQNMRERRPLYDDNIPNTDIQPIPLQKSNTAVTATRDDATKLLQILSSEPGIQHTPLADWSHGAKHGSEESAGLNHNEGVV